MEKGKKNILAPPAPLSCSSPETPAGWGVPVPMSPSSVTLGAGPGLTLPSRVLVVLNEPGQPEIGDFAAQGVRDEDVGGPQVPVDVILGLDEGHAFSNL